MNKSRAITVTNELHVSNDYKDISKRARKSGGKDTNDIGIGSDAESQMELVDAMDRDFSQKPIKTYVVRS